MTPEQTTTNVSSYYYPLAPGKACGFTGSRNFAVTVTRDGKLYGAQMSTGSSDVTVWGRKSTVDSLVKDCTPLGWVRLYPDVSEALAASRA